MSRPDEPQNPRMPITVSPVGCLRVVRCQPAFLFTSPEGNPRAAGHGPVRALPPGVGAPVSLGLAEELGLLRYRPRQSVAAAVPPSFAQREMVGPRDEAQYAVVDRCSRVRLCGHGRCLLGRRHPEGRTVGCSRWGATSAPKRNAPRPVRAGCHHSQRRVNSGCLEPV
jgi:hypothetical protein